jgi:hypothetical protein
MKKFLAFALLLGLGFMVGCGDDTKPKSSGTNKPAATGGSGAATDTGKTK